MYVNCHACSFSTWRLTLLSAWGEIHEAAAAPCPVSGRRQLCRRNSFCNQHFNVSKDQNHLPLFCYSTRNDSTFFSTNILTYSCKRIRPLTGFISHHFCHLDPAPNQADICTILVRAGEWRENCLFALFIALSWDARPLWNAALTSKYRALSKVQQAQLFCSSVVFKQNTVPPAISWILSPDSTTTGGQQTQWAELIGENCWSENSSFKRRKINYKLPAFC